MSPASIEDAVLRWAASLYWRLLGLTHRRPFVLSPTGWALGLFGALALGFICVLAGAVLIVLAIPAAIAVLALSALAGWRYLKKPADLPIVFFSRFAADTVRARDAATEHLKALGERLQEEPEVAGRFELREIPEVLSAEQAKLLLDEGPASAVVFGEVRAIDGVARWRLEMLFSWRVGDGFVTNVRTVGPKELSAQRYSRTEAPAPSHEQFVDADQPLRRLAAERFESEHADRALGTLLVLAGTAARPDAAETMRCFRAAAPYRGALSPQTRAAIEINSAFAEAGDNLANVFGRIERAGEGDANDIELWNTLASISFLRYLSEEIDAAGHVVNAKRAVDCDPSNGMANYNLGEAYMSNGEVDLGLAQFEGLREDSEYSRRPYLHTCIGVVHYNHTKDFAQARDAYRRANELQPSARSHLYLADAHRALGEFDSAREHYREALLIDRTLVDAHRGYWGASKESERPPQREGAWDWMLQKTTPRNLRLRRALRPLNQRLLEWRYEHHPEDSRIHYMLGCAALLREDFATAEERLLYADQLLDGHDLEAQARLAVTRGLQGRIPEAEGLLRAIKAAKPPPRPGDGPDLSTEEGKTLMILLPFLDEPRLGFLPQAQHFGEALGRFFGE